jgi:hypothetical protein
VPAQSRVAAEPVGRRHDFDGRYPGYELALEGSAALVALLRRGLGEVDDRAEGLVG